MDYALRIFIHRCNEDGVGRLAIPYLIPNEATNRCQRNSNPSRGCYDSCEGGYADDIGTHAWSISDLQKVVDILHSVFKEFGLNINVDKTETMIWNWDPKIDGRPIYPESIISISNNSIQNSEVFKYLGVWNTFNNIHIGEKEIEHRIASAWGGFAKNRPLLTNKHIHMTTRINFLNSFVRSRLTYGCHAWRPTQSELRRLDSTYRIFLRSMINNGFRRKRDQSQVIPSLNSNGQQIAGNGNEDETGWALCINNAELHKITQTQTITEFHKIQQSKWISHIIRRENNNPAKSLPFTTLKQQKEEELSSPY